MAAGAEDHEFEWLQSRQRVEPQRRRTREVAVAMGLLALELASFALVGYVAYRLLPL